jgi:hypothetical protein
MANPTTNFGWQMPTSTDLVTDLPADFEVFGQAVDTALVDLKGGTTGQVLSKASNTNMDFTWVTTDDANAIQNSIVDAKGDIVAASANDTPARLAVGNNGETLVADSSTSTGLRYGANFAAGKNKIINGDFRINQRAFTTTTASNEYIFDRYRTSASDGTSTFTAQTFTPGAAPVAGYESTNYLDIASTGQTLVSARTSIEQRIEDVRTFAGQTATISFWAKAASGTPSITPELAQIFGSGGSASVTAIGATKIPITTSWARYTVSGVSVPSISGKTIGTSSELRLTFFTSAGSDLATRSASLGIQTATISIWGVQVEAGSVATAFQTATGTIQGELAACQRYYYALGGTASNSPLGTALTSSTTVLYLVAQPPVTMRTTPTIDQTTGTNYYVAVSKVFNSWTGIDQASTRYVELYLTTSGLTAGQAGYARVNASGGYLALSAEL